MGRSELRDEVSFMSVSEEVELVIYYTKCPVCGKPLMSLSLIQLEQFIHAHARVHDVDPREFNIFSKKTKLVFEK